MRRLLAMVVAVACIVGLTVASQAATYTGSVSKSTFTASVDFTGTSGLISVTASLKNVVGDGDTGSNALTWNLSGVTPGTGTPTWRVARQYIYLQSTLTDARGGIQIYTDNTSVGASPKYTGVVSTEGVNIAGLVCNQDTTQNVLPMCWRIVDITTNTTTIIQTSDNHLVAQGLSDKFPCYFWMQDKATLGINGGFVNGDDYHVVKDAIRGIHFAENDPLQPTQNFGRTSSPDIIYIGADFSNAFGGRSYATSTLRVEAFTE